MNLFKRNSSTKKVAKQKAADKVNDLVVLAVAKDNASDKTAATPTPPPTAISTDFLDLNETPPRQSTGRFLWQSFLKSMTDWPKWPKRLTVVLFALVCILTVSFALIWVPDDNLTYHQEVGAIAPEDVVIRKNFIYASSILTNEAIQRAINDPTLQIYKRDETVFNKKRDELNSLLEAIATARLNNVNLSAISLATNPVVQSARLSSDQLNTLMTIATASWGEISSEARNIFNGWMTRSIRADQLQEEITRLNSVAYTPWSLSPGISANFGKLTEVERSLVVSLARPFVVTNAFLDEAATKQKQEEARQNTKEVFQTVKKGDVLIRKGEIITPLKVEILEKMGLRENVYSPNKILGTIGLVTALVLVLVFYFSRLFVQAWGNHKILSLIALFFVVSAAGMRLLVTSEADLNLKPYLLPVAAVALVLATLFDVNLALLVMAILALLAGLVAGSLEMTLVFFVGGAVGALLLWKAEKTMAFGYAGIAVAVSQFTVGFLFNLVTHPLDAGNTALLLIFNILNGLVATSLAFFTFSVLGRFFGVTTVMHLLELAHPNQPLLNRLMREAPGTYHHSMLVGNLAEQAAERLESDALLARVGAYYHDIGKLSKPAFFIDNQGSGPNIHDTLDPRQSAKIIRAHVADGVELARKNHLPKKVIDIIHQHHGTCLVSFFYQKALNMGLDVSEVDFRYPGPKPQTKVAALVMLADGSEAAVRANVQAGRIPTGATPAVQVSNPNNPVKILTIADVVNKIVDDRIRDGQLDECDLTLRDIERVRGIFVEILTSIYHPRVDYEQSKNKPAEKTEATVVNAPAVELPTVAALTPVSSASNRLAVAPADAGENPGAIASNYQPSQNETETPANPVSNGNNASPKKAGGIGGAGRKIGDKRPENGES